MVFITLRGITRYARAANRGNFLESCMIVSNRLGPGRMSRKGELVSSQKL